MAVRVDMVQLSGNNFVDIGTDDIKSIIASNTYSDAVTIDLIIGTSSLAGGTATTNAIHILKDVRIAQGSSFVWDDDSTLDSIFKPKAILNKHNGSSFAALTGQTYLIRAGSSETLDVIIKRR